MKPDQMWCPEHIRESVLAYVNDGREPGGFLRAVMENDLVEAIRRADETNLALIPHIVAWMMTSIPAHAWGSRQNVERHLARKERARAKARISGSVQP